MALNVAIYFLLDLDEPEGRQPEHWAAWDIKDEACLLARLDPSDRLGWVGSFPGSVPESAAHIKA